MRQMATTYTKSDQTAARVIDGVAFIVTADNNTLHALNETASELWNAAQEGGFTLEQVVRDLTSNYEVDAETARRDVEECVEDLVARGILVAAES